MNQKKIIISIVSIVIFLILIFQSTFIVKETEQVIITQFGKPVRKAIIQKANYFEKRYMEWDGDPNQVATKDKMFIFVDTYARWQITDPLQFFKRLTNERGAQSRLDDIIDGETRDHIAAHYLVETVRSSNRKPISSGTISEEIGDSLTEISVGREKIQHMILESANEKAKDLGIEILDASPCPSDLDLSAIR